MFPPPTGQSVVKKAGWPTGVSLITRTPQWSRARPPVQSLGLNNSLLPPSAWSLVPVRSTCRTCLQLYSRHSHLSSPAGTVNKPSRKTELLHFNPNSVMMALRGVQLSALLQEIGCDQQQKQSCCCVSQMFCSRLSLFLLCVSKPPLSLVLFQLGCQVQDTALGDTVTLFSSFLFRLADFISSFKSLHKKYKIAFYHGAYPDSPWGQGHSCHGGHQRHVLDMVLYIYIKLF